MKPVHLRFAGLHSYREAQEIDFNELCCSGVFGIFGPTGSGKSTILDAITLALYGKVERASRNTQGILNHAEDRLSVSFTFELGSTGDRRRYRVERSYVRDKSDSVRTAHCRLVEIRSGVENVLADKEREVTRQVEEILGLTVTDFTRAVVLPQGKFFEFLSLAGKDRRDMLERLFSLEEYGELLNERLRRRIDRVDQEHTAVANRQQGLGDASEDALKEARKALKQAQLAETKAAGELQQARRQHDELKQVWAWQQELSSLEEAEKTLKESEPFVESARKELEEAERAEGVRHLLEEAESTQTALAAAESALGEAKQRAELARHTFENAEKSFRLASERRRQQEPELVDRKAKLEQARGMETEMAQAVSENGKLAKELEEKWGEIAALKKDIGTLKAEIDRLRGEEDQIRKRMQEIRVSTEHRRRVNDALTALNAVRETEKNLEQARKVVEAKNKARDLALQKLAGAETEFQNASNAFGKAGETVARIEGERPGDEESLANEVRWLERVRSVVSDVQRCDKAVLKAEGKAAALREAREKQLERIRQAEADLRAAQGEYARAEAELNALQELVESLEKDRLAVRLAQTLQAGEPCPVCGSPDHPAPALPVEDERFQRAVDDLEKAKANLENARRKAEESNRSVLQLNTEFSGMAARLSEAEEDLEKQRLALEDARRKLPEAWKDVPAEELTARLSAEETRHESRYAALNEWKKRLESARKELEELDSWARKCEKARSKADAEAASAAASSDAAGEHLERLRKELEDRIGRLEMVRGELAENQIEGEAERIASWDAELDELSARIEECHSALERSESQKVLSEDKLARLEREIARMESTYDERRQHIDRLSAGIGEITGGAPAAELIDQVFAALEELRKSEKSAHDQFESANQEMKEADQRLTGARTEWNMAERRAKQAASKLEAELKRAGFSGEDAARKARDALRSTEERRRLSDQIEAYNRDKQRLEDERARLLGLLSGRSLTQSEWDEVRRRLEDAEKLHEKAVSERGAAQRAFKDLEERHSQWVALKAQRKRLEEDLGRLGELQSVLRGSKFVEFIAEERLNLIARDASARLGQLTRYRYALEIDGSGGFVIRDDANGGVRRPVHTLSGGETFLTSLALAIALSAQIQLRGRYPLEFFFLDEGFGSLDQELLEVVISSLERLHLERMNIGVISHVPELRTRLRRRVIVEPAVPGGEGSRLRPEIE